MKSVSVIVLVCLCVGLLDMAFGMESYMVPMRDGVNLATYVYLPEGDGPWPVVLIRGGGKLTWVDDEELRGRFVSAGYVVVGQDPRGRGDSEGQEDPGQGRTAGWGEIQDGYDTVEWVAEQEWSNGKIGTLGGSYSGISQHLMAGSYPPHLVCQYISCAPSDTSQGFYRGGIPRPAVIGTDLHEGKNMTESREHGDANARVAGMSYAGFHVGGWYDTYTQGPIDGFVARQYDGGPGSAGNQKLVMGPWGHYKMFNVRHQGDLTYPENSLYTSYWSDCIKFFDHWLKGIDDGFTELPTVRYYVMGDVDDPSAPGNEWRSVDDWPIPYSNFSLYLSQDGLVQQPGSDSADAYSYDPTDPVPWVYSHASWVNEAPLALEQGLVEDREDVLVYSTQPLPFPVEVTGRIYLQLYASSSCPDTDFIAKVTDVYPDGRSMIVTEGGVRARKRSMGKEELLEPGEVYELWIDLWSTSIVFNKGHRIRVMVTSSSHPGFGINPNTGLAVGTDTEKRIAENTIHFGATYPSRIVLPVAGPDSDGDGVSDILDALPYRAGPHTKEEIAIAIQDTNLLIDSLNYQGLQEVLRESANRAEALLEKDELVGSGFLVTMIRRTLAYDTSRILLPEARRMTDTAIDISLESLREGKYSTMALCLEAGLKLGTMREIFESEQGGSVLIDHLLEAEGLLNSSIPKAFGIVDWCNRTDVRTLAAEIQRTEDSWQEITNAVSERDLRVLEGLLKAAKKELTEMDVEGCETRLTTFRSKLDQLGIQIPESALLSLLGMLLLPALLRRRRARW